MSSHLDLEPDPDFARQLEWQVRTALRREARFSKPAQPSWLRWTRSAALVLISVAIGAGGVVAAERLGELRERELLVARAELMVELQRARMEHISETLERLQLLYQTGSISVDELDSSRIQASAGRYELRRLEIDVEEVHASGREPNNELDAPLVAGRDFVLERLGLEAERLRIERGQRADEDERLRLMHASGMVGPGETGRSNLELARLDALMAGLQARIDLRLSYRSGAALGPEVRLLGLRARAETTRGIAAAALETLEREIERWEAMVEAGLASSSDRNLIGKRTDLEAEIALAELELELIDVRLGR